MATSTALRITVIGTGYLGLTHAVCMADLGHEVLAIDVDEEKIAKAARGEAPFYEPGLEPLLRKNLDAGRLRFTTDWAEVGEFGQVHFLCVGTPQVPGGHAADLTYVYGAGSPANYLTAVKYQASQAGAAAEIPTGTNLDSFEAEGSVFKQVASSPALVKYINAPVP